MAARSKAVVKRALKDAGGRCLMCGLETDVLEVDHVVPLALGGEDAEGNTLAMCAACHRKKTREDVRAIRKADRIKRKAERVYDPPMGGRKRGLDGRVKNRE